MRIYQLTDEFKEGKYLVVRRDGTVPEWPHFVLSARDPAAPEALRTYAYRCAHLGLDKDYTDSAWDLSRIFENYCQEHGPGDPAEGPHRQDNAFVISMMRGETDLTGLGSAPRQREDIEYIAALQKIVRSSSAALAHGNFTPIEFLDTLRGVLQTAQDVLRARVTEVPTSVPHES